jgi:hypothetical protein
MEGRRRDEPGAGGLRIGHGSIYAGGRYPSSTFRYKVEQGERNRAATQGRPYGDFASACFLAIAATIPTIDIKPMDLPMESSRPKTW